MEKDKQKNEKMLVRLRIVTRDEPSVVAGQMVSRRKKEGRVKERVKLMLLLPHSKHRLLLLLFVQSGLRHCLLQ